MTRRMLLASLALVLVLRVAAARRSRASRRSAPAHTYAARRFPAVGACCRGQADTGLVHDHASRTASRSRTSRRGPGPHTGVHLIIVRRDLNSIVHVHPPIAPGREDQRRRSRSRSPARTASSSTRTRTRPVRSRTSSCSARSRVSGTLRPAEAAGLRLDRRGRRRLPLHDRTDAQPCMRSRRGSLTITVTDPHGKPARVHAVVRRARARDLLPEGLARLLPHARLRARRVRLHELPRRDEGDRQLVDARKADRRRARPGRRARGVSSFSARSDGHVLTAPFTLVVKP